MTGASGFLGSRLTRHLVSAGAEVHGVSRLDRGGTPGPTCWWQADVGQLDQLERVWEAAQPEVVYHLSGAVDGAPRLDLLLPTYHSLLTSTVNLLGVSASRGCRRLVLAGSLEEEDADATSPISPYAAAKTAARDYAQMCHDLFEVPVVNLRVFMGYGPGQPTWKLIPSVIRALADGDPPALSSGTRELDWTYVDDIVEGLSAAAVAEGVDGMTLDIGTGRLASIREVVERLAALVDPSVEPRFGALEDRSERPPRAANTGSTWRHLGWKARTPLEQGLQRTVDAYRLEASGRS